MGEVGSTAVSSTDQPTATPTASTPTPSTTATPTQNPAETSNQPVTQESALLGLNWEQATIALFCVAVTVLAAALIFFNRRNAKPNKVGGIG